MQQALCGSDSRLVLTLATLATSSILVEAGHRWN
jgi:hypothetical protein